MFGKIGFAALAMVPVFGATHTGDLRELYDQMYPVSALTRDAFILCHESDATFVRALQGDRDQCLDHMPHSFAVAIGRIPPDNDLLAWAPISEGARAALRLARVPLAPPRQPVEMPHQLAAFVDGHGATAAPEPLIAAMDLLTRPGRSVDDAALARLVLAPHSADAAPRTPPLPLLAPGAPTPAEPDSALSADPQAAVAAGANGA
jgi:hypothetical protein